MDTCRESGKITEKRQDLYIDIDGVLVGLGSDKPYPTLKPDALLFIEWAIKKGFNCHYLTCWTEEELRKQLPILPKFHYANWGRKLSRSCKTDGIDFSRSFYWLEDGCTGQEYGILQEKGAQDSYIFVDPSEDYALTKIMEDYK